MNFNRPTFVNYPYASQAHHQSTQLIQLYPNHLKLNSIHQNQDDLMVIYGTLPVPYKNSTYNIPIEFILPKLFPSIAPYCRVVPTEHMKINISSQVHSDGKISHPYIQNWDHNSQLTHLSQELIHLFKQKPPVYAAPKNQPISVTPYDPDLKLKNEIQSKLSVLYDQLDHEMTVELNSKKKQLQQLTNNQSQLQFKINQVNQLVEQQKQYHMYLNSEIDKLKEINGRKYELSINNFEISEEIKMRSKLHAIQDTLDVLQQKFEKKDLALDVWMKMVNQLGREYFMLL
eukprot:NODE_982_length_2794_cov_0.358442.p1 type:complete len:287 gc:universal NODE_982_length_2794_cov_0.358442:842-1702(+)